MIGKFTENSYESVIIRTTILSHASPYFSNSLPSRLLFRVVFEGAIRSRDCAALVGAVLSDICFFLAHFDFRLFS